jgi:hypothetical protein
MTMSATTKNFKQQQQHLALPVVLVGTGMTAAPWFVRTKLLLYAALGFALGVAVTVSIMGSAPYTTSTIAVLRGGALGLFFPPAAAAATNLSSGPGAAPPPAGGGVVHVQSRTRQPSTTPSSHQSADNSPISASTSPPAPAGSDEVGRGAGGSFSVIDDDELLARASSAPRQVPADTPPKVAFLFLIRWDLPMAPLWEKFFEGHAGLYTVYVHTDPVFNGSEPTEGSAFFRRRIPSKVHSPKKERENSITVPVAVLSTRCRWSIISFSNTICDSQFCLEMHEWHFDHLRVTAKTRKAS